MKVDWIPSQRETPNVLFHGFIYQKSKPNEDNTTVYRCIQARKAIKCPSSLSLLDNKVISRHPSEHNHRKVTNKEIASIRMKSTTKQKVRNNPKQKPKAIFEAEINAIFQDGDIEFDVETAQCLPKYLNMKKGLYNQRRKEMPKLSQALAEISLDGKYINTVYHKRFLLFDTADLDQLLLGKDRIITNFEQKIIDDNRIIVSTTGDGNCLYNACSLALIGF